MPISHVFDTYAKTAKGRIMHFDMIYKLEGCPA
jgi:hypothetical protein